MPKRAESSYTVENRVNFSGFASVLMSFHPGNICMQISKSTSETLALLKWFLLNMLKRKRMSLSGTDDSKKSEMMLTMMPKVIEMPKPI